MDNGTTFLTMNAHGHAVRGAMPTGYVIASSLSRGSSRIEARAPSLKFSLSGEEVYDFGDRQRTLRSGEFMLVEAGQDVEVHMRHSDRSVGLCVYFPSEEMAMSAGELMREKVVFGGSEEPISRLLRKHAQLLLARPELGAQLADPLLQTLCGELVTFLGTMHGKADQLSAARPATRIETLRRLELARSFIHARLGETVTLDAIARHAALSRFHLTRRFCEVYGLPPLAYHRRLRLEDAAAKLRAGTHRATDLAEQLGYGSLSAFVRAFRQHVGISPGRLAGLGIGALR